MKECPRCSRTLIDEVETCPTCGYSFINEVGQSKERSSKPTIAGILMMIAAVMGILLSIMLLSGYWDIQTMMETSQNVGDFEGQGQLFETILNVCAVIIFCLGLVEFIGGLYVIKRKSWAIGVIGALGGVFILGFLMTSSVLSIIALILILISKDEF